MHRLRFVKVSYTTKGTQYRGLIVTISRERERGRIHFISKRIVLRFLGLGP